MQTWVCLVWLATGQTITSFDMQNEDAMVLAAKEITSKRAVRIACINQFDGQVVWFHRGEQVERP